MASNYFGLKTFGRANGNRGSVSTSAAAYRSGERIRDERTGAVYDHSRRRDVMHKEILLPSQYGGAGAELNWALDRSRLWNAAEQAEHRRNSRVAREYVVALPYELKAEQRLALAQSFARTIAERYGNAVDLAVHAPKTDPRNFHAHLLTTTRQLTREGFGSKTTIEWNGDQRRAHGLPHYKLEHAVVRESWMSLANEALREAGLEQRISAVRDPDAVLRPDARAWLPRVAYELEKRGQHSYLGDLVRKQFADRQQARLAERERERALVVPAMEPQEPGSGALERQVTMAEAQRMPLFSDSRTLEQIKAQALQDWRELCARQRERVLEYGAERMTGHVHEREPGKEREQNRGRDDDYGL